MFWTIHLSNFRKEGWVACIIHCFYYVIKKNWFKKRSSPVWATFDWSCLDKYGNNLTNWLKLIDEGDILKIQNSIDTLEASTNVDKLRQCAAALYRGFFEKEPFLFTAHLYLILGIYFACIPVQLFNAYDATMTYVLYPIIIYLLFAVPLYANAFHNPIQHPELNRTFQKLNTQIYTNAKQSKTYAFAYRRKDLRM